MSFSGKEQVISLQGLFLREPQASPQASGNEGFWLKSALKGKKASKLRLIHHKSSLEIRGF